jgi:uncharacterized protein YbaP (TraB family)
MIKLSSFFITLCLSFASVERTLALPLFELRFGDCVSYAFGTMHEKVSPNSISATVIDQIQRARVVYVENLSKNEDSLEVLKIDMLEGRKVGRNNKALFASTDWLKLRRVLSDADDSPEVFSLLSPKKALERAHRAFEIIEEATVHERLKRIAAGDPDIQAGFKKLSYSNDPRANDVDDLVKGIAKASGRTITALDSAEVFSELDDLDARTMRSMVRARIVRLKRIEKATDADFRAYANDVIRLGNLEENFRNWIPGGNSLGVTIPWGDLLELPEFKKVADYTFNRHDVWLSRLLSEIREGNVFIAVGKAHFVREPNIGNTAKTLLESFVEAGIEVKFIGDSCEFLLTDPSHVAKLKN